MCLPPAGEAPRRSALVIAADILGQALPLPGAAQRSAEECTSDLVQQMLASPQVRSTRRQRQPLPRALPSELPGGPPSRLTSTPCVPQAPLGFDLFAECADDAAGSGGGEGDAAPMDISLRLPSTSKVRQQLGAARACACACACACHLRRRRCR